MNTTAYQAPLFDYSRCDKISGFSYRNTPNGVDNSFDMIPIGGLYEMARYCKDFDGVTDSHQDYWNNMFGTWKLSHTSENDRHNWFHSVNPSTWNNMSSNSIYNDSSSNTSYYLTFCHAGVELNSTWVQTTPTWQYDLHACLDFLPYDAVLYAKGQNANYSQTPTSIAIPFLQRDYYDLNVCHFANASLYPVCSKTNYYDRMQCGNYVTSNYTANKPTYFGFSESYRNVPEQNYRKKYQYDQFTTKAATAYSTCDYFAPFGDGIYDYVDWSLDDPYLFSSYWWTDDYGTIYPRAAGYDEVLYLWGPASE